MIQLRFQKLEHEGLMEGRESWIITGSSFTWVITDPKLNGNYKPHLIYYDSENGYWTLSHIEFDFPLMGIQQSRLSDLRDEWIGENVKWEKL